MKYPASLRFRSAATAGLAALVLSASLPGRAVAAPEVTQLTYNHPGLITDLGVGLWAWPLPMDWNEDGLMDLVVACTDTPSNGVYVFLNTGVGLTLVPESQRTFDAGLSYRWKRYTADLAINNIDSSPMMITRTQPPRTYNLTLTADF